jgi:ribosomal protein S12 methylthiotransferase accessory factor YcaO
MEAQESAIMEQLEALSERDDGIGYWNGPSWMTKEQQ